MYKRINTAFSICSRSIYDQNT